MEATSYVLSMVQMFTALKSLMSLAASFPFCRTQLKHQISLFSVCKFAFLQTLVTRTEKGKGWCYLGVIMSLSQRAAI